jgi:hypothetical protein
LAASILYLALKLGFFQGSRHSSDDIVRFIADFSGLDPAWIRESATTLLSVAKNFDKDFPNLKNLKTVYAEEIKLLKLNTAHIH